MLHKLQKVLSPSHGHDSASGHDKHLTRDAAFDVAYDNFGQIRHHHDRMLTNAREFLDRMKFFGQSNHVVATDLYDLYATGGDNQFKDLAGEFHQGHGQIMIRDVELLVEEARTTLLQKIDRMGHMFAGLEERIKQRSHTLSEMDDYTAKVAKYSKKEKPIEPGSKEERVEQRHQELVDTYTRMNMALTGELVDLWNNRGKIFNPIMADFAAIQAAFAQLLTRGARLNNASAQPGGEAGILRNLLQDSLRAEPIHLATSNIPFEFGTSSTPGMGSNIGSNIGSGMGSNMGSGMGSNLGSNIGSNMGSGMGSNIPSGMGSTMGSNVGSMGSMGSTTTSNITTPISDTFADQQTTSQHHLPLTGHHHQPLTGSHHQPLTGLHHQPLTGSHHQPLTGSHQPLTGASLGDSAVGVLDRPVGNTTLTGEPNPQVCVVTPIGEVNKDFVAQEARRGERWNNL